jgi:UDP-N-acetyl-2-amino-2-deoxyglucuronate dehydrogenase
MRAETIRIGILGGGGIIGAHASGYARVPDLCRVVAVAEPSPARHPLIRELFGPDVRIAVDYRDVLAMPDVDAVDIILPHALHLPATEAAATAGKPVLVEKVMARNIWECDRMIEACDHAGVSLTVCQDRRYHAEWMALKEIVESGFLGDIFFWKLDHNQNVVFPEGSWARTRRGLGGGAIMSCLTHQIDALRWYGGEVESVTCMTQVRPERLEGEVAGAILARMRSGAMAELSINWWTTSDRGDNALWYELVQVCGTWGEAYRMEGRGTFIKLHGAANAAALQRYGKQAVEGFVQVPSGGWTGHQRCIEQWVKSLRGGPAAIVTDGRTCRGTVEVAEAAYFAERTGQLVRLPLEPHPWSEVQG